MPKFHIKTALCKPLRGNVSRAGSAHDMLGRDSGVTKRVSSCAIRANSASNILGARPRCAARMPRLSA